MNVFSAIRSAAFFLGIGLAAGTTASAQINSGSQWTWVSGDSTAQVTAIYGLPNTADPAVPGPRNGMATWTDASGTFWLFGGEDRNSAVMNDLWKYTVSNNQWTRVQGDTVVNKPGVYGTQGVAAGTNMPGGRKQMAFWTDGSGNLWLFGGIGIPQSGSSGYLNDLWKYNIAANQWTWVKGDNTANVVSVTGTVGVAGTANKPGSRYATSFWRDASDNLWMMGGRCYLTSASYMNYTTSEVWRYSVSLNQWTCVSNSSYASATHLSGTPGDWQEALSWVDTAGNFWLFGGYYYGNGSITNTYYPDLWKYTPGTGVWTAVKSGTKVGSYGTKNVAAASNQPPARSNAAVWRDAENNLWLFGGDIYDNSSFGSSNLINGRFNDLWKYNIATGKWTWVGGANSAYQYGTYGTKGNAAAANTPGAKVRPGYWKDATGAFWLFGGEGDANSSNANLRYGKMNDLWKLGLSPFPTPVTLLGITATPQETAVAVRWEVGSEQNTALYQIERSQDGSQFVAVGQTPATGTPAGLQRYQFTDREPLPGASYYRVKASDFDGTATYSATVRCVFALPECRIDVFPNPTASSTSIRVTASTPGRLAWEISNASGQTLRSANECVVPAGVTALPLDVSALAPGTYRLRATLNGAVFTTAFTKD